MSIAVTTKRNLHSSSLVSRKVMKFVTLCDTDCIDDEIYDIEDGNNLGYYTVVNTVLKKPYKARKKYEPSKFSVCHRNFLFLAALIFFDVTVKVLLSVIDVTYYMML